MPAAEPLYDLVLLLDSTAEDDRRAQILSGVEDAIGKGGEVVNKQDWGMRSLAFEIRHKKDAEYHLLQFHGTPELLRQVDRTLRITDEVVRFRIIKLAPGTPPPPEHRSEPRPAGTAPDEVPATVGAPAAEESAYEDAAAVEAPAADAPVAEAPVAEAPAAEDEAAAPADAEAPEAVEAVPAPESGADEPAEEPSDAPSA
jgi:small subunit ribosomal protein S6